jgi:hypothetical protein
MIKVKVYNFDSTFRANYTTNLEKIPEHVDTQMPTSLDGFQPGYEGGELFRESVTTEPDPGCVRAYSISSAVVSSIPNSRQATPPLIEVRRTQPHQPHIYY